MDWFSVSPTTAGGREGVNGNGKLGCKGRGGADRKQGKVVGSYRWWQEESADGCASPTAANLPVTDRERMTADDK
ncbi:hypothetical protein GW17_00034302 [Ensete ventricosum]|nr:hypothetical protein GW17_00034302 [Ensete ventricosum]RZS13803.1 hypothetical protein BHM03_00045430 [Ensete ventricosum]